MAIKTTKTDIIWNYIGTIVSMASGFILLPFLVGFLTDDELGLWYVYIALSNFAMLFEFGFNPTFARNIVYVLSGARSLSAQGRDAGAMGEGIDWHLLNMLIKASKLVYAGIACVVTVALVTAGSIYVAFISKGMDATVVWVSWSLFCVAVFLNLYFLWTITVLRGYGDIAGEKRASTIAKLAQLGLSVALLICGLGLLGASIGYLASAIMLRILAVIRLRSHREIQAGCASDKTRVILPEVCHVLKTVAHLAWRDGVVTLALYASTQAMSLLSSLYLGLAQTGTYSVLLQLATAVYNFAVVYPKSFYPAMQSAYAEGDVVRQREIVATGIVAYWGFLVIGALGICLVVLPLLPVFKPGIEIDYWLFLAMCLYLGLLQHHSLCSNYIVCRNEIPYMPAYILASILGLVLVAVFDGVLGMGAYGIVAGQAVSQLVYNNWKWPCYIAVQLNSTYAQLVRDGLSAWRKKIR